jgi:uncharacterized membrane protein
MTTDGRLFIYIGTYSDREGALADYAVVRELHSAGAVGSYDAAVVTKDADGKVHATRAEMAARHAGWGGALAGALIGLLFPPAIIGTAIVGGAVGVVGGHLWRGLSRSDLLEFGETIDAGAVALVVAGENKLEETLDTQDFTAVRYVLKNVDLDLGEVDEAVLEATRQER